MNFFPLRAVSQVRISKDRIRIAIRARFRPVHRGPYRGSIIIALNFYDWTELPLSYVAMDTRCLSKNRNCRIGNCAIAAYFPLIRLYLYFAFADIIAHLRCSDRILCGEPNWFQQRRPI